MHEGVYCEILVCNTEVRAGFCTFLNIGAWLFEWFDKPILWYGFSFGPIENGSFEMKYTTLSEDPLAVLLDELLGML